MKDQKVPFITSFFRSQTAAVLATATDFLVLIILTELFGIWYVLSTVFGGIAGAIVSFTLSRQWAFEKTDQKKRWQAFRYALVSALSLLLNTVGVYFLTEYFGSHYSISKIIVAVFIGVFVNFFLFRYFVFK